MDKHYVLYVKTNCPFCVQAKDELFRQKLSHTVHVMDNKAEDLQELKDFYEYPTVPIVFLEQNGMKKLIGGCTDLIRHIETTGG